MNDNDRPSTREVYQVLKDVALGVRTMQRSATLPWREVDAGRTRVDVDDWTITLYCNGTTLSHCEACRSAQGRAATLEDWQRFGTNPVDLLSQWEHAQLERLLSALE
jgi:hypothetical protein